MQKILVKDFKKNYLYFEKKYINKRLSEYNKNINILFPYVNNSDRIIFLSYTNYIQFNDKITIRKSIKYREFFVERSSKEFI